MRDSIQNRRARIRFAALVIGAITLVVIALYVENLRDVLEARSLLKDIAALRVNQTTDDQISQLVKRYRGKETGVSSGDCSLGERTYWVSINDKVLNALGPNMGRFRLFGNRVWFVDARFSTSEGHLCRAEYRLFAWIRGIDLMELSVLELQPRDHSQGESYSVYGHVQRNIYYLRTEARDPTPEERRRAFDFRLDCLARFGGCGNPCEIAPAAWTDAEKEAKSEGVPFPPPGFDVGCTLPTDFQAAH
jgi:hypothetical protein